MVRYAGYIRVSSEKQVDSYSLDAQRKAIEQYVASRGDGQIVKWYEDAGESAKTTQNRDEFLQMRTDAGKRLFDVLVVHKFDRLNRNRMDAMSVKLLLRKTYGIKVFSVTEPGEDDQGAVGVLVEGLMETVAEWFSRNLATEVRKGRYEKTNQGIFQSGTRPFGYHYISLKEDEHATVRLTPHPIEAPVVIWLYETYATGTTSAQKLANILNDQGYKTTRGYPFRAQNVRGILRNPLYKGELKYRQTVYYPDGRRKWYTQAEMKRGNHEPLVSTELWDKVQDVAWKKQKGDADTRRAATGTGRPLLRGNIYCVACMAEYDPDTDRPTYPRMKFVNIPPGMKNRNPTAYYRCEHGHPWVIARVVEQELIDYLLSDRFPDDWKYDGIKIQAIRLGNVQTEKRIQEIKAIIERMDFRWDRGFITDKQDYITKRQQLSDELAALEPKQEDVYAQAEDIINNFPKHWHECKTLDEQRELVGSIVESVHIENRHLSAIVLRPSVYIGINWHF